MTLPTIDRGSAPGFPMRLARPLLVLALLAAAAPAMSAEKVYPRVQPLLSTSRTIIGEKIAYPTGAPAKVAAVIVTLKPGEQTGWHTHGVPVFGYILEGELTIDYGPHGKRVYRKGDSLAEAIHAPHNGRNTGIGIMRVLAVFMGAKGRPNSVPAKAPK
jgi:quercetin dioxygenase-like cupin family protein